MGPRSSGSRRPPPPSLPKLFLCCVQPGVEPAEERGGSQSELQMPLLEAGEERLTRSVCGVAAQPPGLQGGVLEGLLLKQAGGEAGAGAVSMRRLAGGQADGAPGGCFSHMAGHCATRGSGSRGGQQCHKD